MTAGTSVPQQRAHHAEDGEVLCDPWAHIPGTPDDVVDPAWPADGDVIHGDGGIWVPVSCQDRDATVQAAGGLSVLLVLASWGWRCGAESRTVTEWGCPDRAPAVVDCLDIGRCRHAVWVPAA